MRIIDKKILFSATDLCNFLECEHLTCLDRINLTTPLPKTPDGDDAKLFQDKGFEHEQSYQQKLKESGIKLADLSDVRGTPGDKADATFAAMKTGVDIIFQGTLLRDNLYGHPDFLRKVNSPSNLGPFSYEVMDTKLARNPKTYFIIQLCFYSDLLTTLQDVAPRLMTVVLGDRTELNFRFDQFSQYYQTLKERFLDRMLHDADTYPETTDHCGMCRWRGLCEEKWLQDDHLNQVANITKIQIKNYAPPGFELWRNWPDMMIMSKSKTWLRIPWLNFVIRRICNSRSEIPAQTRWNCYRSIPKRYEAFIVYQNLTPVISSLTWKAIPLS